MSFWWPMVLSTVWCVFANRISEDLRSPVRFTSIKQFDAGHLSNFLFDIIFSVKIKNVLDRFSVLFSCLCSGYIAALIYANLVSISIEINCMASCSNNHTLYYRAHPGRRIPASPQAWLAGFDNLAGSNIKNIHVFSVIYSFSEIWYQILGKHLPC